MKKEIHIYGSPDFVRAAAEKIGKSILMILKQKNTCRLVLAGGNTPADIYTEVAVSFGARISWENVQLFWGDERAVPPGHPNSNYRMVQRSLLHHIAIPRRNVYRIKGEMGPQQAAARYAGVIRQCLPAFPPRFDLILLGLGEDGHTASLFPDTEALKVEEEPVAANFIRQLDSWRVTMTFPALNNGEDIMFLVAGESKAETVREVVHAKQPDKGRPATLIRPDDGTLHWILDSTAAALI